jgi:hypothetical protein
MPDAGDPLTVRDLIALLSELPPDLPVYLADWNEHYAVDFELTHAFSGEPPYAYVAEPWQGRRWPEVEKLPRRVVIGPGAKS